MPGARTAPRHSGIQSAPPSSWRRADLPILSATPPTLHLTGQLRHRH